MIPTQDHHFVNDFETVWEIRYRWYNAETSLAEPEQVRASDTKGRIWKDRFPCSMECLRINKENQNKEIRPQLYTVKMIADENCR